MKRDVEILGVGVNAITWEQLLEATEHSIKNGGKRIFAYVNINAINLAQRFEWFRNFLNNTEIAYADGQGVRLGAWITGKQIKNVIPLTRWIWDLCRLCEQNDFSLFLLGTTNDIIQQVPPKLRSQFKNIRIAGFHHGYFKKEGPENEAVVGLINELNPDILIVGFGMPLQEEWIGKNIHRLNVKIAFNAGACFDFIAGAQRQCPRWISQLGFEWLFRFFHEPRRLFTRYFVGNTKFLINVIRQRMGRNTSDAQQ